MYFKKILMASLIFSYIVSSSLVFSCNELTENSDTNPSEDSTDNEEVNLIDNGPDSTNNKNWDFRLLDN